MTIRSKRRKEERRREREEREARMRGEPPPAKPPGDLSDNLKPAESAAIEIRAQREAWLNDSDMFVTLRKALAVKVAKIGTESSDPNVVIKAFNALSRTEQRSMAILIQALRMNKPTQSDLPSQVATDAPVEQPKVAQPKPFEIIQELIGRHDVRRAIGLRPTDADEFGGANGPAIQTGAAS